MDYTELKKKFLRFTMAFFAILVLVAYLYCTCFPMVLILTLYVFFILYLMVSFWGKEILDRFQLNPFAWLFISFFTKVVVVVGFTYFLIQYFMLERKLILLLLIVGYLLAATFDFILLARTNKNEQS